MVPKIIHIIVGPKANFLIKKCIYSWSVLNDVGFEIMIWDDNKILDFMKKHYAFTLGAIENARNHAEVADLARYAIVHYFGGYYFDWDIELLNKERFLYLCDSNPLGFLIQDPINQTLAPEAFSALPGEFFFNCLLDNIVDIFSNNFRDSMPTPHYSGPFRMREVFYFHKQRTRQSIKLVKEVFLYDYLEIRQMPPREVEVPMIHYWIHSWLPVAESR